MAPDAPSVGAGRSQRGDHRVRSREDLGRGRHQATEQVERQIREAPDLVLHVVAEHPQEEHVPADVQPPPVEEHRDHHGLPPALVGTAVEVRGTLDPGFAQQDLLELPSREPDPGFVDGPGRLSPALCQVLLVGDLPGDLRLTEREQLLFDVRLPGLLPQHEHQHVRRDDREGHPCPAGGGVVVPDRDEHGGEPTPAARPRARPSRRHRTPLARHRSPARDRSGGPPGSRDRSRSAFGAGTGEGAPGRIRRPAR